jgi:hypothetical protein
LSSSLTVELELARGLFGNNDNDNEIDVGGGGSGGGGGGLCGLFGYDGCLFDSIDNGGAGRGVIKLTLASWQMRFIQCWGVRNRFFLYSFRRM